MFALLGVFVASGEQYNSCLTTLHKIDPIPGAIIDSKFRDTFAHRLDISRISQRQTANPDINACPRLPVMQFFKPSGIYFGLADFHAELIVSQGIHKRQEQYSEITFFLHILCLLFFELLQKKYISHTFKRDIISPKFLAQEKIMLTRPYSTAQPTHFRQCRPRPRASPPGWSSARLNGAANFTMRVFEIAPGGHTPFAYPCLGA